MKILLPAYGHDYKSKKSLLEDFNSGKDFIVRQWGNVDRYISKRDIEPGESVEFRYSQKKRVFIHKKEERP